MHDILNNPTYLGERVYNRLTFSKFVSQEKGLDEVTKRMNDQSEWIVVPNAHPAIVTRHVFQKANSARENMRSDRINIITEVHTC